MACRGHPRSPLGAASAVAAPIQPRSISNPLTISSLQVKSLGRGCYGEAMLMRDKATGELVAVKYIEKRKVRGGRRMSLLLQSVS